MRYALLVVCAVAACAQPERDLAQCRAVSPTAEDLRRCLILEQDWDVEPAERAYLQYALELQRSWREAERVSDSVSAVDRRRNLTRARRARLEYCREIGVAAADCDTTVGL